MITFAFGILFGMMLLYVIGVFIVVARGGR